MAGPPPRLDSTRGIAKRIPRRQAMTRGAAAPAGRTSHMGAGEADQGTAIIARNTSKLFLDGTVVAFRQLTLSVRHQEILCIVGPSGCGKTTFLRAIAGLIDLSCGDLLAGGKPVRGPPDGVAMVFQHFGLLPWKTVFGNAGFGLKIAGASSGVIKERVQ